MSERDPVNADDSSTPRDTAAERFAAAVDGGVVDGDVDPELARELEIVNRLAAQGPTLDPTPEVRARARSRLLAALSEDMPRVAGDGPPRAS